MYLTFDDGPNSRFTPKLLDLLDQYEVKATFFVNGNLVRDFPEIVDRIVAQGHALANHTQSHKLLARCSREESLNEISKCQDVINEIQQDNRRLFRPPQGLIGFYELFYLVRNKYRIFYWTIDSRDSFETDFLKIVSSLKKNGVEGGILLFHDDSDRCISVLETMIPFWVEQGIKFRSCNQF